MGSFTFPKLFSVLIGSTYESYKNIFEGYYFVYFNSQFEKLHYNAFEMKHNQIVKFISYIFKIM